MPGKRALVILEPDQLVRVTKRYKPEFCNIMSKSRLTRIVIKPEYPGSVMIELEDGVVLEFIGAWGTLDKEAAQPNRN